MMYQQAVISARAMGVKRYMRLFPWMGLEAAKSFYNAVNKQFIIEAWDTP